MAWKNYLIQTIFINRHPFLSTGSKDISIKQEKKKQFFCTQKGLRGGGIRA